MVVFFSVTLNHSLEDYMIPLLDPLKFRSVLREIKIKHNDVQNNTSRNDNVKFSFYPPFNACVCVCVIQFVRDYYHQLQLFEYKGAFVWNHQSKKREFNCPELQVCIQRKNRIKMYMICMYNDNSSSSLNDV